MSNVLHRVFGTSALSDPAPAPSADTNVPSTLAAFYDKLGPLPTPAAPSTPMSEVRPGLPPMDKADGALFLQDALPGTDPVEHERDLLFIVNYAMEHGGTRTQADLAQWLQTQLAYAQRENQWESDDRYKQAPPDILQLSQYIRRQDMARRI